MFKDFEKLTKNGAVIFGNLYSGNKEFFCFWQPTNSFASTKGLLEDFELSEYGYIADALEKSKCIPFARGNTPLEAYDNMLSIYNRVFDDTDWLLVDYSYYEFINATNEITGWVDFGWKNFEDISLFQVLESYEKSYEKYVDIMTQKYNEFKSIEKVQNYFEEEYDYTISSSMIEKNLEYIYKNESTMILSPMASGKTNEKQTSNF